MAQQPTTIMWFRQDLRLADNPALSTAACQPGVLPIYIHDTNTADTLLGGASRCFLHDALNALNEATQGHLCLYKGDTQSVFEQLVQTYPITHVCWNRCYEPHAIHRDKLLKAWLNEQSITVHSENGCLLWEPWDVMKPDGTRYQVYTPFYRKGCLSSPAPRRPLPVPNVHWAHAPTLPLHELGLYPQFDWGQRMMQHWHVSEADAHQQLQRFLEEGLSDYKQGRNYPARGCVSRLSAFLHFGLISPNQAWYAAQSCGDDANIDHFLSELAWREFSYSQLYHFPELPVKNWQVKFDRFPWRKDRKKLTAWQKGLTGYPIIDAGMRELWQTGYMHNRIRMVVGSFLVKNCMIHWREGAAWFWDCLVDADLANNSASWQWVAGCGADAAPYFRIFNPITQGEKFDPDGDYTRQFIPELSHLPNKYLFAPWTAPEKVLLDAGVQLGKTYPKPIVDIKLSRTRALDAFSELKSAS